MVAMHRFTVGALAGHAPQRIDAWLTEFEATIAPRIPPDSLALLREHAAQGHLCALVTATSRLVAAPFARALGLAELLCTEPERDARGHVTGGIVGVPCFREHKRTHVEAWLAGRGTGWTAVRRSWFYSDSMNDLPLLSAVSDPVAVNPDAVLRSHAVRLGWPMRSIGEA